MPTAQLTRTAGEVIAYSKKFKIYIMTTALLFIIVLVILIISHELGHFLAAKMFGVRVDEFGLGFPPRIWGKQYGETLYSLNWIPFGGFVKILGEDSEANDQDKSRNFTFQATYKKVIILAAGVLANIFLAWIFFSVSLQTGLLLPTDGIANSKYLTNQHVAVDYIAPGSPAEKAGMKEGDSIISLGAGADKKSVTSPDEIPAYVKSSAGKPITIEVVHAKSEVKNTITLTPESDKSGSYKIGIALSMLGEANYPFFPAFVEGGKMTWRMGEETAKGLYHFAAGLFAKKSTVGEVSGPVGIFKIVGSASAMGLAYVMALVALLSINLAILNILPIPALDGGRILFCVIEKIKGSPIRPEFIQGVHSVGFALLIILMLVITAHDIIKLF